MGYRTEKLASMIRDSVGDAIANRLSDPRISPLASVTRVAVSGDLQHATVYISVMGRPAEQRTTLTGLRHATGRIHTLLAQRLRIRHCPRITFVLDESIKKGSETIRMIDEVMRELKENGAARETDVGAQVGSDGGAPAGPSAESEARP